jgi:hypothetical protein
MLDFFATLFVFGSFWFWIVALSFFGGLIAFAENEKNFLAGILTTAFVVGIVYFNNITINWNLTLYGVLIYFAIGLIMTYIKWITMLKKRAFEYSRLKEKWAENHSDELQVKITDSTNMKEVLSDEQYKSFVGYLKSYNFINYDDRRVIPRVRDKKDTIISWAMWWPAVMFWSLLNDYIRGAYEHAVLAMRNWYDNIAKKIFSNVGFASGDNEDLSQRY